MWCTNPCSIRADRRGGLSAGSDLLFLKESNIRAIPASNLTANFPPSFYVLPGVAPFLNGMSQIGSFAGIDPETGTDTNLVYTVDSANSNYAANLGVLDNPAELRGKKLAILSPDLDEDMTGPPARINLRINHKNALGATNAAAGEVGLQAFPRLIAIFLMSLVLAQ